MLAADAHALLRRRRARVVALLAAEEHVLELVHPGVGEEQRRVVAGHERRAGHDAVAVLLEVLQEGRRGSRWRSSRILLITQVAAGLQGAAAGSSRRAVSRVAPGCRDVQRRAARGSGSKPWPTRYRYSRWNSLRRRWPSLPRRRLSSAAASSASSSTSPNTSSTARLAVAAAMPALSICAPHAAAGRAAGCATSVRAIASATRASSIARSSLQARDGRVDGVRRRGRGGRGAGGPALRTARAGRASSEPAT